MKENEIIENNKLIAEFMELEQGFIYSCINDMRELSWVRKGYNDWCASHPINPTNTDPLDIEDETFWDFMFPQSVDLYYNSSYDWMLDVLERIESLHYTTKIQYAFGTENPHSIHFYKGDFFEYSHEGIDKREVTYEGIIGFINKYNTQKIIDEHTGNS